MGQALQCRQRSAGVQCVTLWWQGRNQAQSSSPAATSVGTRAYVLELALEGESCRLGMLQPALH